MKIILIKTLLISIFASPMIALAQTTVTPSGSNGLKARFMFYLFNGLPSSGSYVFQDDTPTAGLTGIVNEYIGSSSDLQQLFDANSYSACGDIPTTGSISALIGSGDDTISVSANFSAGTQTVPSHFPSSIAGQTYSAKIDYLDDGTNTMDVEVLCDGGTVAASYVRLSITEGTPTRELEFHYHADSTTGAKYIDCYQTSSAGTIFIARFYTDDGDVYRLYIVRAVTNSSNSDSLVGAHGSASSETHAYNFIDGASSSNSNSISTQANTETCLDLTTAEGADSTNCTSSSLSVSDPGTFTSGGTSYNFTAASVNTYSAPAL